MNANELIEKAKEFEASIAKLTDQVGEFKKQLENASADEEKKFKRMPGKIFWYITYNYCKFIALQAKDDDSFFARKHFENNNYFLTEERAQEVADKLNYHMRLERLHDELCPDYKPNFKTEQDEKKFYILFDYLGNKFSCSYNKYLEADRVYFPSEETVLKACDILNAELE